MHQDGQKNQLINHQPQPSPDQQSLDHVAALQVGLQSSWSEGAWKGGWAGCFSLGFLVLSGVEPSSDLLLDRPDGADLALGAAFAAVLRLGSLGSATPFFWVSFPLRARPLAIATSSADALEVEIWI